MPASKATVGVRFSWYHLLLPVSFYIRLVNQSQTLTSILLGLDFRRLDKLPPDNYKILPKHSRHPLPLLRRPRRHPHQ